MSHLIKVCLVDDDPEYLASMEPLLTLHGFDVTSFTSFAEMESQLSHFNPDILVLDVNTPGGSAFNYLPGLRAEKSYGLVLVSGNSTLEYRVTGLECGADAYMSKPVDIRELKAIIYSLYERLAPMRPSKKWALCVKTFCLTSPNGTPLILTEQEFLFIKLLMESEGGPVSKDALLIGISRSGMPLAEGGLHVLISRLRKKFTLDGVVLPIRAIRNVGYCFYESASIVSD